VPLHGTAETLTGWQKEYKEGKSVNELLPAQNDPSPDHLPSTLSKVTSTASTTAVAAATTTPMAAVAQVVFNPEVKKSQRQKELHK
jgi:hypothetical protein